MVKKPFCIGYRHTKPIHFRAPEGGPPGLLPYYVLMSEDYQSKKARLERISQALEPASLRGKIPGRQIEDIAALPQSARTALGACLEQGIKISFAKAVRYLAEHPETTVEQLKNYSPAAKAGLPKRSSCESYLKNVLIKCYPEMQEQTAKGLAESLPMRDVAALAKALEQIKTPANMNTDFIVIVIYTLLREALEEISYKILSTPVFIQAIKQSSLPLPDKKISHQ